jgi:hypothetical protein
MLVVVVGPGLGELAVTNMEHQHRWTANSLPVSFGVRAVQPDGMVVVGDHVMERGPEGPAGPLGEGPDEAEHLGVQNAGGSA